MRKRRKSIAPWLFFIAGLVLLLSCAAAVLALAGSYGWLDSEWQRGVETTIEHAWQFLTSDGFVRSLVWLGGVAGTLIGATFTFLASWHFAEINLSQRIEDLKKANTREHLSLQPRLLALARPGLSFVPADIETSRLTLLRKWLSGWSEKEQARVLAASIKLLAKDTAALSAATVEAQHRQITAHLVRGYQHAARGDDEKAFEEFEAATKVRADDIVSRDVAAGWARRMNKQTRELELLVEMQQAAMSIGSDIDRARALRREAELYDKRQDEPNWFQARKRLDVADRLLRPLIADKKARLEFGRVLTLFCEVQCSRKKIGKLDGPNGPLTRARACMAGVAKLERPEEPEGEVYGEARVLQVEQQVAELREDPDLEEDDNEVS